MERLWAPWRQEYILSVTDEEAAERCFLCDEPASAPETWRDSLILACGERAFIILNRYPYNPSHLMVVPRAHVDDPSALSDPDFRVVAEVLRRATAVVREQLSPQGINVGMNLGRTAGAGVADHCHYHVVPRWNGDTNFMPVIGQAKVMSIGLDEAYDRLHPHLGDVVATVEGEVG